MIDFEKFKSLEFRKGETSFYAQKFLPMEAFDVLEEIRSAAGSKLANIDSNAGVVAVIASVALSIPPADVKAIRNRMFKHVYFTNKSNQTRSPVYQNEDSAFEGLDPVDVYDVFLRCLVINFFSSFAELLSRIEGEETAGFPSQHTAT